MLVTFEKPINLVVSKYFRIIDGGVMKAEAAFIKNVLNHDKFLEYKELCDF